MVFKFKSTIYGIADAQNDAFDAYPAGCKPVWDANEVKWVFESNLGECGLVIESEGMAFDFLRP